MCTLPLYFHISSNPLGSLRLERVIDLLVNGDLNTAYSSLLDSNQENGNAISGVGESFFTKLLYFAGANCDCLAIKPLIFDNNIKIFYRRLLNMLNEGSPRGLIVTLIIVAKWMLPLDYWDFKILDMLKHCFFVRIYELL